jgi:hypothetical protein
MLEVGLADDPGLAVGASPVVRRHKPVDPHNPKTATCELVEGGPADPSHSEYNGIVSLHGGILAWLVCGCQRARWQPLPLECSAWQRVF